MSNLDVGGYKYKDIDSFGDNLEKNLDTIKKARLEGKGFRVITDSKGQAQVKIADGLWDKFCINFWEESYEKHILKDVEFYKKHAGGKAITVLQAYTPLLNRLEEAPYIRQVKDTYIRQVKVIYDKFQETHSKGVYKFTEYDIPALKKEIPILKEKIAKPLDKETFEETYKAACKLKLLLEDLLCAQSHGSPKQIQEATQMLKDLGWPEDDLLLMARERFKDQINRLNPDDVIKLNEITKKVETKTRLDHLKDSLETLSDSSLNAVSKQLFTQMVINQVSQLQHIVDKTKTKLDHPSLTGNREDLVTESDLKALLSIQERLNRFIQFSIPTDPIIKDRVLPLMENLKSECKHLTELKHITDDLNFIKIKVQHYIDRLESPYDLSLRDIPENIEANFMAMRAEIAEAKKMNKPLSVDTINFLVACKKVALELSLDEGSTILLESISDPRLKGILEFANVQSKELDQAILESLQKHRQKILEHRPNSFNVVIEGAGPTGLFTAIKQYAAGARVHLFEQRKPEYTREQVVRLDPKWVMQLKFYLGTEFDKLFINEGHKGILRLDGFVEITINTLEQALAERLKQIQDMEKEVIEIHYQSEVQGVGMPPSDQDKYTIQVAKMKEEGGKRILSGPPKSYPADMVICCGGKNVP